MPRFRATLEKLPSRATSTNTPRNSANRSLFIEAIHVKQLLRIRCCKGIFGALRNQRLQPECFERRQQINESKILVQTVPHRISKLVFRTPAIQRKHLSNNQMALRLFFPADQLPHWREIEQRAAAFIQTLRPT